jgi:5'-methylthioadenosine phosphorylase
MPKLGFIGGSGLYDVDGLENKRWVSVDTPYGTPSDQYLLASYRGVDVVFLPRHGRGHKINPSNVNYRANVYGMKALGVETLVAVSAVGSLKEEYAPLDFVVPTQFVDRTYMARPNTFFDKDIVAHVSLADPVCGDLAKIVAKVAKETVKVHFGGTYINMEGPQFSTKAESHLYRQWGMDIIGMTTMLEARLAREAEICFCMLAAVTDYDCWREEHDVVSTHSILEVLHTNAANSKKMVKDLIVALKDFTPSCACRTALANAVIGDVNTLPLEAKRRLGPVIEKYLAK